ncbi:hypothetical protein ABBQ32_003647 [Trebouxia sp. C0010 RCD-2024]
MLERMTSQSTRRNSCCCMRQALRRCDCSLCAQGRNHKRHSICRSQPRPLLPTFASPHSYRLYRSWLRRRAPALAVDRAGVPGCHAIVRQPEQTDYRPPAPPDISLLSSELQQQWHVDRNMHLGAIKVRPCSTIMAVWKCSKCPAGQPHVWTTSVVNRRPGSKCPYCINRRLCLHNSLATVAPGVAKFWNHNKNVDTPEQVLAGSRSKAHWKCSACKCAWQARIDARVRARSGCPKCARQRCARSLTSQPTFAEAEPAELAEWDHDRNEADGFYPDQITLGSSRQVHWICSCCPKGQPHRWTAMPNHRVGRGQGCPACAGHLVCVCNTLETIFPSIATELDVDKNGFAPSEVTAWSRQKGWWKNAKRGSWKQRVDVRTDKRLGSHLQ